MKSLCALVVLSAGAAACSLTQINPKVPASARAAGAASPVRVAAPLVSDVSLPLREMARHAPPGSAISEPEEEEESGGGGFAIVRRPTARTGAPGFRRSPVGGGLTPSPPGFPNPATLLQNFDGLTTADVGVSNFAADSSGAIGPNHYVDSANFSFAIYDRSGTRLLGPSSSAAFWNGFAAAPCGGGWSDVVVLYDRTADRWFVSRFAQAPSNGPWYQCFAISQTPDPTGQYYRYAYKISDTEFNDYPKFGIWPDGYYMTAQRNKIFPGLGLFVAAFERSKMLAGDSSAAAVLFTLDNGGHRAGMLPADWDGQATPPANAPNYLVRPLSTQLGWPGSDALEVWRFHVDWTTPASSTLAVSDTLSPAAYTPACGMDQNCIPQPDPAKKLDPLASGYLMYRLAYRNFGDHEALVLNHTVDNGDLAPAVHAGVRWYELRRNGGAWSIAQQSTHAPDGDHRWIGSAAMDQQGNIAVAYNVSGTSRNPSLAYAFRLAGDPLNTLSDEATIHEGGGSQTGTIFWGDYSQLTLDPTDDCTFWYVGAYQPGTSATQNWNQRIAAFRLPACPLAATSLSYTGATTRDYHDAVTLSATLANTFANYPIAGQTIHFGLGAQGCDAVTDGTGAASCGVVINQAAGSHPLTASFAGTAQLKSANVASSFTITHEETTTTYSGPTLFANGSTATLSGVLKEDGITPTGGRNLTLTVGIGVTAQSCVGVTDGSGTASCTILVAQPLGPNTVSAAFAGDAFYKPSSDTVNAILFEFLRTGSFVVGDLSAAGNVTFWSADWAAVNGLTGGAASSSFKGFAATLSAEPPACGITWTTGPGNSSKPPATLPGYLAVLVASGVTKSGSAIAGNGPKIVIVKIAPGYAGNPGHPGTGSVVATLCQ
jgi:hypothetical protein